MPVTPNYSLRYPDENYSADVAAWVQQLATDVDTQLKAIDGADDAALAAEVSARAAGDAAEVTARTAAINGVNATINALPFIQARSTIVATNSSGGFAIAFPVAFRSVPVVVACSGDYAIGNAMGIIPAQVSVTSFGGVAYNTDGTTAASSSYRVNWIAFGT